MRLWGSWRTQKCRECGERRLSGSESRCRAQITSSVMSQFQAPSRTASSCQHVGVRSHGGGGSLGRVREFHITLLRQRSTSLICLSLCCVEFTRARIDTSSSAFQDCGSAQALTPQMSSLLTFTCHLLAGPCPSFPLNIARCSALFSLRSSSPSAHSSRLPIHNTPGSSVMDVNEKHIKQARHLPSELIAQIIKPILEESFRENVLEFLDRDSAIAWCSCMNTAKSLALVSRYSLQIAYEQVKVHHQDIRGRHTQAWAEELPGMSTQLITDVAGFCRGKLTKGRIKNLEHVETGMGKMLTQLEEVLGIKDAPLCVKMEPSPGVT